MGAVFAIQTGAYVNAANIQRMAGRAGPRGAIPTYRLVKSADDWLFAGSLTPGFWASMAVAAGLEDCLVDPRFAGAPLGIADPEARAELAARVDAAFATKTRAEWLDILEQANVPRAPVLTRDEFLLDPQVAHNKMAFEIDDTHPGSHTPGATDLSASTRRHRQHHSALLRSASTNRYSTGAIQPPLPSQGRDRGLGPHRCIRSTESASSTSPVSSPGPTARCFCLTWART